MKVLQCISVLFLFNLTQKEILGSGKGDLYDWFDQVRDSQASDDIPIYWDGTEPTLKAPSLETPPPPQEITGSDFNELPINRLGKEPALETSPPPQEIIRSDFNELPINRQGTESELETPMTLKEITMMFVECHKKEMLEWPDLINSIRMGKKWDGFCMDIWKKWKGQRHPSNLPYCTHSSYIRNSRGKIGVDCHEHTNVQERLRVNLLGCFCENLSYSNRKNANSLHTVIFYLARKNAEEYFLLQGQMVNNPKAKTLIVTDYITGVNYWDLVKA